MITVAILTVSDKGARGEREDGSRGAIEELLPMLPGEVAWYGIVPDEKERIEATLVMLADDLRADLVLTSGGTGLGPRDVTPEATAAVVTTLVPGIAEAMRIESLKKTPMAMLSRAIAGVRKRTLIVNLPGSPKAVKECLEVIAPVLPHAIETLKGEASECARLRETDS